MSKGVIVLGLYIYMCVGQGLFWGSTLSQSVLCVLNTRFRFFKEDFEFWGTCGFRYLAIAIFGHLNINLHWAKFLDYNCLLLHILSLEDGVWLWPFLMEFIIAIILDKCMLFELHQYLCQFSCIIWVLVLTIWQKSVIIWRIVVTSRRYVSEK